MQNLVKKVVEFSQKKKNTKDFIRFVENFYSQNQERDFENYEIEKLESFAKSSFELLKNKKPREFKIKSNNSQKDDSRISILDIINDDKPFLVDSIVALIEKDGYEIENIIHPIYFVKRAKNGDFQEICEVEQEGSSKESIIQIHLVGFLKKDEEQVLIKKIEEVLENIAIVVDDWQKITKEVRLAQEQIISIDNSAKKNSEISEIKDFVSWLVEKGFIFLGFKEFEYKKDKKGEYFLEPKEETSLGVFRSKYDGFRPQMLTNATREDVSHAIESPYVIEILKSIYKSKIHRLASVERVRIQKFAKNGEVVGEYRLIGLFTSSAYYQSSSSIPLIRGKIANVIKKSGFSKGSHNYKDLVSVLEDYPRDELFQIDEKDLMRIATGVVMICGRSKIKLFVRKDKFSRFISCLIFMPKEHSNYEIREKIINYLAQRYKGVIADTFVQITESSLVRLQLIIKIDRKIVNLEEAEIEKEISEIAKPWPQGLKEAIQEKFGDDKLKDLFERYRDSFTISYKNRFDFKRAAIDISRVEEAVDKNSILFNLYKSSVVDGNMTELKIYSPNKELILSDMMPVLESFGLNVIHEHVYVVSLQDGLKVWIHYFRLNLGESREFNEDLKARFEQAISLAWTGVFGVGSLNRLFISAGLNWRQVSMIRAYAKYVYQAGFRHDQEYVSNILVRHDNITKLLVDLFEAKFDVNLKLSFAKRVELAGEIFAKIKSALNKVSDASHDIAIRKFLGLIDATLRTNFYQTDENNEPKCYISFKFDCKKVPDLPLPLPYAEIFVFSNQTEGVHLRGGKVARGGLRWSDRHEDFRTEVLGLVKAQTTKNAVIVPVGSKGGFVVKKDASKMTREEYLKEGIECYKIFLRGLLDLTDNIINGKIVHPQKTILHDDSDPYLVVAADKGTATFSDIANSISAEYNFWLGDAFASGGSVGYDHKKMGITAKGGWVSVSRHFREMGIDTQSQDFTCVGIGDMAGDVFGNGMLLSPHIRMVAAFNHMHIFLDPNPDAKKSFKERQRMFNLPRSSWLDYDKSLISQGGGIFERGAKSIKLSKQIKEVLLIEEDEVTPVQLMSAILKAPVDLMWNGGIGTYVKALDENNSEVGDRANDALRINGCELRCKVIGEGGNLGFTQKGRIEYALNGGRINTDAMDNSAGVDCSDHEVNIKIALTQAMRAGKLNLEQRNKILESMTNDVAGLVLNDNRLQTQAISIAQNQGISSISIYGQFLSKLEKSGLLNRKIEFLPSTKELQKRQVDKIGFTRPELCVMLAYSKMEIYQELLSSKLPDDEYFEEELCAYFPKLLREKFGDEIKNHQLRREIIATQITNFVVNRAGITFINQICQESGFKVSEVVKCFIIACDSFGLRKVWEDIENVDSSVSHRIQAQMCFSINKLLERSILWLLRNHISGHLDVVIKRFKLIADELSGFLPQVMAQDSKLSYQKKCEIYSLNNVQAILAQKIASMDPIASTFDIAEISAKAKFDLKTIAKIYYEVGTRFSLKWLRNTLSDLPCDEYWERLSNKTIIEDFYSYQMKIAKQIVDSNCDKKSCAIDVVGEWINNSKHLVEIYDNFIAEIKVNTTHDVSMFVVALNRLKPLVK